MRTRKKRMANPGTKTRNMDRSSRENEKKEIALHRKGTPAARRMKASWQGKKACDSQENSKGKVSD